MHEKQINNLVSILNLTLSAVPANSTVTDAGICVDYHVHGPDNQVDLVSDTGLVKACVMAFRSRRYAHIWAKSQLGSLFLNVEIQTLSIPTARDSVAAGNPFVPIVQPPVISELPFKL